MMVCRQDDSPRQIYQVLRTQHASFSHSKAIQQVKRKRYPTKPAASRVRPSGGARSAADARPLGARTLTTAACTSSTIISRRRSQDDPLADTWPVKDRTVDRNGCSSTFESSLR
jgi:hypothetical protein